MKTKSVMSYYFLRIMLLCVLSSSCDASLKCKGGENATELMMERYREWLKRNGRVYGSRDEWNLRFGIYQSNVILIDEINSQNLSYRLTDNEFASMTNLEFRSIYMGYKSLGISQERRNCTPDVSAVPQRVDWRKKGAVTPVKNQGTLKPNFIFHHRQLLGILSSRSCGRHQQDQDWKIGVFIGTRASGLLKMRKPYKLQFPDNQYL